MLAVQTINTLVISTPIWIGARVMGVAMVVIALYSATGHNNCKPLVGGMR